MTTTMVDYQAPPYAHMPQRKPLPHTGPPRMSPLATGEQQLSGTQNRVVSSPSYMQSSPNPMHAYPPQSGAFGSRRTLSNATTSTTSTSASGNAGMAPVRTNSGLRRSSSSRSGNNAPMSYVALMRKQKATVWCDRSQQEDPRHLAAQRAAKMRAAQEVQGGNKLGTSGRPSASTSSVAANVRSKIRHHGVPKATQYNPGNFSGTGVPMRLSATEVDEGDSDEDSQYASGPYHQRTGSGRSSLGSGRRVPYLNAQGGRFSTASTPPSGHGSSPSESPSQVVEEETPVPTQYSGSRDYFIGGNTATGLSGGSGSSGERENSFGDVGTMPSAATSAATADQSRRTEDELRRRGSVDDRTMTMSRGVRLFVANPDLSD